MPVYEGQFCLYQHLSLDGGYLSTVQAERTGYTEAALRTRGKVVEKTGKQERKEFKTSHWAENVTNDCLTDCLSEGR
ncbi:hypothetical protein T10_1920 [Trichinella papuae]|uniref:Uncharacterized protein n=1 Tax=Trichinella papuae TaxID=268474 RepID=A0A0V1MII2_9BILA|nr:hypothetical protein T10_1920 [Trichinella papuae]